jgi:chemotaxis protein CheD
VAAFDIPVETGEERSPDSPIYVHPGRMVVSRGGHRLSTVLGSCVAVCLFDPDLRAGGMNHFVLPDVLGGDDGSARFAGPAVRQLIQAMVGLGARKPRLVASLFGGCASPGLSAQPFAVGSRNVEVARNLLHEQGIPVMTEDVKGTRGRKIIFNTDDGLTNVRGLGR